MNDLGEILLLQRDKQQHLAGLWSFPGGKIEASESPKLAAQRELQEETGLSGTNWLTLGSHEFSYPDRRLNFHLFSCVCNTSDTFNPESEYAWVHLKDLTHYPMPEANIELVRVLKKAQG